MWRYIYPLIFHQPNINMEEPKVKIERIIAEGINFKFGDYISQGFDIFKKEAWSFIGFTVIFFILAMVINFIPFIGPIANNLVVTPALTVGIYLFAYKLHRGEPTEFGDFFKGFDFTAQLAISTLVKGLLIGITLVPFAIIFWKYGWVEWYMEVLKYPGTPPSDLPEFPPFWAFLLLLPAMFLSIVYAWTYLFIAFYKMEFWDALEASRKLITKNFLILFAFMLVIGMILAAGFFLFCIGILVTFPAAMCMTYAAFADVTKLNEIPSEGAGIEEHLIE
jgi:hypothetical protein